MLSTRRVEQLHRIYSDVDSRIELIESNRNGVYCSCSVLEGARIKDSLEIETQVNEYRQLLESRRIRQFFIEMFDFSIQCRIHCHIDDDSHR